jgi:hypothetical protein
MLGVDLYYLWLTVNEWTRRRVETAEFLGPSSLRRRVSVDLVLPELDSETILLPLALLSKRPLINLDVTNESHSAVPVCTRQENGDAAWAMLTVAAMVEIAEANNEADWPELDDSLLGELREIVFARQDEADAVIHRFRQNKSSNHRRHLTESAQFMGTGESLASHFLLLTPTDNRPTVRRILKFAYTEPLGRVGGYRERFFETMGWRPARFEFAVPAIGEAESFHFELCAPEELDIARSELLIKDPAGSRREVPGVTAGPVAHLYASGDQPDFDGVAAVWLQVSRSGLPRAGFMLASFTLAVILVFRLTSLGSGQADTSSAILLTLPALVATVIIRPGEHGLVTDLLFGVRMTIAVIGLIAYSAALLLAIGVAPAAQKVSWICLQVGAMICWASLLRTLLPLPTQDMGSSNSGEPLS